jgi:phosphoglycerate dehydrogenase-like enzyme
VSRRRPVTAVLVAPGDDEPPGLDGVRRLGEVRIARTGPELEVAVTDADVLAVYDFRTPLVAELGERAAQLDWIHAASAGVDAVLTPAVVAADTVVTNAQGVFDDGIAEWVLAVLALFAKDLRTSLDLQRTHTWRHRESRRLAGRRVLVVGAGSIGGAVARLLGAVGMEVRGVARRARIDDPDFTAVVAVGDLHHQLGWADDVVVTAPLTPATHHLLDARAFTAMGPGAHLVNVGRGPVVDTTALLDALRDGRVAGAALDVFETEPLPADHPFWDMDEVLVSPHMSGDTVGWVAALGAQFEANLERWRAGEALDHVVDKQAMSGAHR